MNLFQAMLEAAEKKVILQTVTLVACSPAHVGNEGQMMLLYPDGQIRGVLIDDKFAAYVADVIGKQVWKKPGVMELTYQGESGYKVFWDRLAPEHKVFIFGAGHISCYLVEILALLDYEITVVDDRPDFANPQRFPRAAHILCQRFSQALPALMPQVDTNTAVIIVTRGHQHDFDCLRASVASGAGYLGMIGSRCRVRAMLRQMQTEGIADSLLETMYAPVGLDIGAGTPAEIAVSIAAEVVKVFSGGGSGRSISKMGEAQQ